MSQARSYIFGPVPSRRLGLSLGVDLVPHKVCTLDCLYCQVGHTTRKTIERESFVDIDAVFQELVLHLEQNDRPDFITLSGSGEPTLNRDLGQLITRIKAHTDVPVALITNGTLLFRADVRRECCRANVILPSLDAAEPSHFLQVNRPHPDLSVENHIAGLEALRQDYPGQIWLEIFLIQDLNTQADHLSALKSIIERIRPDRIHLNTAVRPTADPQVQAVPPETLQRIADQLGPCCEVVADFQRKSVKQANTKDEETILTLLKRRPCSAQDVAAGLSIDIAQANSKLTPLVKQGKVAQCEKNGRIFYLIPDVNTP